MQVPQHIVDSFLRIKEKHRVGPWLVLSLMVLHKGHMKSPRDLVEELDRARKGRRGQNGLLIPPIRIYKWLVLLAKWGLVEPSKYNQAVALVATKWFVLPLGEEVERILLTPRFGPFNPDPRRHASDRNPSLRLPDLPVRAPVDQSKSRRRRRRNQPSVDLQSAGGGQERNGVRKSCRCPFCDPSAYPAFPGRTESAAASPPPDRAQMHKPIIVGFAGRAGCGKSTVSSHLCTLLNDTDGGPVRAVRGNFAGPLKRGLAVMGITKKNVPAAYRTHAQSIGAGMRADDKDWWVKQFQRDPDVWMPTLPGQPRRVVVVDDVRYLNECKACDLVFFLQPDFEPKVILTVAQQAHESEAMALAGFDPELHTAPIVNPTDDPKSAAQAVADHILHLISETSSCPSGPSSSAATPSSASSPAS